MPHSSNVTSLPDHDQTLCLDQSTTQSFPPITRSHAQTKSNTITWASTNLKCSSCQLRLPTICNTSVIISMHAHHVHEIHEVTCSIVLAAMGSQRHVSRLPSYQGTWCQASHHMVIDNLVALGYLTYMGSMPCMGSTSRMGTISPLVGVQLLHATPPCLFGHKDFKGEH